MRTDLAKLVTMSRVKNPQEKKKLSLKLERRNTYGENAKASSKNIPRNKQRQHQEERRVVRELLSKLTGVVQEDEASSTEIAAKSKVAISRWRGFKKRPDTPLDVVLRKKRARRKVS